MARQNNGERMKQASRRTRIGNASDLVRFYQRLGFFPGIPQARVIRAYREDMGCVPDARNPIFDADLLLGDEERTCSIPGVGCIGPDSGFYRQVLPELARLTGGAFAPAEIVELWETRRGPIRVKFRLALHTIIVTARWKKSAPDLYVLQQINSFLTSQEGRFECMGLGIRVVMWLTREQKLTIQRERGNVDFWW